MSIFLRTVFGRSAGLLAISWCFAVQSAWAISPTSEEEALNEMLRNRIPLVQSGDRQWLFYVDRQSRLRRVRTSNPVLGTESLIGLRGTVRGLSASQDGSRIAFSSDLGCVGMAQMDGVTPRFSWLPVRAQSGYSDYSDEKQPCSELEAANRSENSSYSSGMAIGISSDGKRVAIAGHPVRIVDTVSGQVVLSLPSGAAGDYQIMHLRFVDNDQKLLAVLARQGQVQEGESKPSDMEFLVWDLPGKRLFNLHNTRSHNLNDHDYRWDFSESSGVLWAVRTDSESWTSTPEVRADIRPYAVNLKQCSQGKVAQLSLPSGPRNGWRAFSADPLGRWVATVEPHDYDKKHWYRSHFKVWSARDGRLLLQRAFEGELNSLLPSHDGAQVFGVVVEPVPADFNDINLSSRSTGAIRLVRVDLQQALEPLLASSEVPWPQASCVLEGETAVARAALNTSKSVQIKTHTKIETGSRAWAVSPSGQLWRASETDEVLERVSLLDGKVVERIKYDDKKFDAVMLLLYGQVGLHSGAETLTFSPALWSTDRKVADVTLRRNGSYAAQALRRTKDVAVFWAEDKPALSPLSQDLAGVAAFYSIDGQLLEEKPMRWGDFQSESMMESEGGYTVRWESYPAGPVTHGWELGVAGSIRAYIVNDGKAGPTVFWQGLTAARRLPGRQYGGRLLQLNGARAADFDEGQIRILDATARSVVATIKVDGPSEAIWVGASRMLIVTQGNGGEEYLAVFRLPP